MRCRIRWPLLGLAGLVAVAGAGCGGPSFAEVAGTVMLNGKPLSNVQVEFLPDPTANTAGPRAVGVTDAQGQFKLTCTDQRSGAVIGSHRVLITDLNQWEGLKPGREDSNKPLKPSRIPLRYTDVQATPFKSIEVKAGVAPIKLELTSP